MFNIIIIGYYNHYNIGDEQYKLTFNYMLNNFLFNKNNYLIKYIDCDILKDILIKDSDIIIIGGGDILNNYFLDEINKKFKLKPNKIIGISIGLPYKDILINTKKINIIDYLFIRSKQDLELFSKYFLKERIFYISDISYFLLKINKNILTNKFINLINDIKIIQKNKKIIVFSLNRHIYLEESIEYYNIFILNISKFIIDLINKKYKIIFLPYNTSNIIENKLNHENDILIHNDVYNYIKNINELFIKDIINIDYTLTESELFELYDYCYLSIPMRFHACLFSIYKKVPFIPIFTTRKIKNLLLDCKWDYYYELEKDKKDIPISFDINILDLNFNKIINNHKYLVKTLNNICIDFENNLNNILPKLINVIENEYKKINEKNISYSDDLINKLLIKLNTYAKNYNVDDFRYIKDKKIQDNVINIVSYYLTNNTDSIYNYGLSEKMFVNNLFNYKEEWKWIINDYNDKKIILSNNNDGYYNINFIDQKDYSNSHRFGWQYVFDNIKKYHNNESKLYLDLYLDRTFHWKKDIYKLLDIIPYKNDWIGFIHHTFDSTFSTYNNYNLFNNQEFIDSLIYCKGLFVLSNTLQNKLVKELNKLNLEKKPIVYVLMHPTDYKNIEKFSFDKFLNNSDKKLLHIGGWLRNIYSFYELHIDDEYIFAKNNKSCKSCKHINIFNIYNKKNKGKLRKCAIKGKNMNNYFPFNNFLNVIKNNFIDEFKENKECDEHICQNISQNYNENTNNWNKHFYDNCKKTYDSVEIIEHLSNEEYDKILTENIVFINLVDASAVNTLIECVSRNTPIIINKHPAVVELLGINYPLYYGDNNGKVKNNFDLNLQVNDLMKDSYGIYNSYKYLKNIDKSILDVDIFTEKFINIVKNIKD